MCVQDPILDEGYRVRTRFEALQFSIARAFVYDVEEVPVAVTVRFDEGSAGVEETLKSSSFAGTPLFLCVERLISFAMAKGAVVADELYRLRACDSCGVCDCFCICVREAKVVFH